MMKQRITLLLLATLLTAPALGAQPREPRYFSPEHVDGIELLPPPPEDGTQEQETDLATARAVCKGRTAEQEAAALKSASLSLFLFAPAIGDWFKPGAAPKTEALFNAIKTQISGTVDHPKQHWKRKRPYQVDPELSVGHTERSYSYPSGHSTRGTVYALLLAEIMPEKREQLLRIGRQIGWDRVIIGKHYPTDVFAGRVMGKAIHRELMKNAEFRRAVEAARSEIKEATAQTAAAAN